MPPPAPSPSPLAPTDAQLVAQALGGEERAFTEIARRFERPVYHLIYRMVGEAATAEDLAQEAFLRAFRRLDTYDPERRFSSWLFKVAHNVTLDHLRRSRLETVSLEPEPGEDGGGLAAVLADQGPDSTESQVARRDLGRALAKALAAIRPEYREILLLRFRQGLAYQEIAEIQGAPLGTVKTNIHRARKELGAALAKLGWRTP